MIWGNIPAEQRLFTDQLSLIELGINQEFLAESTRLQSVLTISSAFIFSTYLPNAIVRELYHYPCILTLIIQEQEVKMWVGLRFRAV
jgi:hypothetical protein